MYQIALGHWHLRRLFISIIKVWRSVPLQFLLVLILSCFDEVLKSLLHLFPSFSLLHFNLSFNTDIFPCTPTIHQLTFVKEVNPKTNADRQRCRFPEIYSNVQLLIRENRFSKWSNPAKAVINFKVLLTISYNRIWVCIRPAQFHVSLSFNFIQMRSSKVQRRQFVLNIFNSQK